MADRSIVLLTGATGFLGAQVARYLLADLGCTVVALVRAEDDSSAARRLRRAWWSWPELLASVGSRVEALAGDVCEPRLGLDDAQLRTLVRRVTHIIHTAAELRLEAALDELRRTNVNGTRQVLELARAANRDHGLERFAYVSTAYVCGKRSGQIEEDSFSDAHGFSTPYEQSKYEAEALMHAAQSDVPVSIFRPGMIVGDSKTGAIKTFNTIYAPLNLYLTGRLPLVPTSRSLRLNIVPVDYVAECVARLTFDSRARGLTFHLVPPSASLPTAGELLESARAWAADHLNVRLRRTLFLDLPVPDLPGIPSALRVLRPYLRDRQEFLRINVDTLIGTDVPDWQEYLPHLLEYAVAHNFMHNSERTAYEQVLHRLSSRHWPVRYHDITAQGAVTRRDASDVRQEMLTAGAALRAVGVKPGDRVAIVGENSSRYLALDVAIGLIGAVSVPLYPTSPPAEIDSLLTASGARVLLIGAPQVMARAGDLRSEVRMVAFGRGPLPAGLVGRALDWPAFLSLGTHSDARPAEVEFGELATLRYTSGTTGPPKAAAFDHVRLRWMAESLAGLLPWQARTRQARYLSFLPMNHVVEGMLATYGAYFLPTPLDIYFLEDFRALPTALRTARPTVFFSVPRVYEKLWDSIRASLLGRWYLAGPPGPLKGMLRNLVRETVLRRAGLERCAQLIVGSAPISETLLRQFHELRIEIFAAYGLTEAPLVTINRIGANRLGTAGQPLPETQLAIAADDEILVRGPQVMCGYVGGMEQPFRDGWLLTGDLGRLTPERDLIIDGRKKELIATAYGKKVHPDRIESLLRQIPGVSEAMLVGEGRPYCAALLWTTDGETTPVIAQGIERVNAQLSHAEQVKSWRVLHDDLSIGRGDLTPSLKLKRPAVAARFAGAIESLYAEVLAR